jgi:glycosyltransferase involved in cell wall biosynthesis
LKILLATVFPLPGGGIWTFVSNLKQSLNAFGHHVDILCCTKQNSQVELLGTGKAVDFIHDRKSISDLLLMNCPGLERKTEVYHAEMNRYLFEQALTKLDLGNYDIIHAQDVIAATALSRVKPPHTPLVTSVHGYLSGAIFHQMKSTKAGLDDNQIWNMFLVHYYKKIEQIGYVASDYIHTSSMWMRKIIENEFGISPSKIVTFNYGMDIADFGPIKEKSIRTGKRIILSVSRLVYLKGLEHLIHALSLLKMADDSWECWIFGEGEMEIHLKRLVKNLGLQEKVLFWGTTKNLKNILQRAEMLVLPSLQENQPFAVIEAQLLGVPVIVSNAGGLPEMIENGKDGFVVDKGNSHALYNKINLLLNDKSLRDQMSHHSSNHARKKWNLNNTRKNTLELYTRSLMKKRETK